MNVQTKQKLTKAEKEQIAREKARDYYLKNRESILEKRRAQNSGKPRGRPRKDAPVPEQSTTIE
jgi:hypothetical protein